MGESFSLAWVQPQNGGIQYGDSSKKDTICTDVEIMNTTSHKRYKRENTT